MGIEDEWRLRAKFTIAILLELVCFPWKLNNGSKLFAIILRSCWCIIEIFENIFLRFMIPLQMQSFSPLPYLFGFILFFQSLCKGKDPWLAVSCSNSCPGAGRLLMMLEDKPMSSCPIPDHGCFGPLLTHNTSLNFLPWVLRRGSAKAAEGSEGRVKSVSLCHDPSSSPWNRELIFQRKGKKLNSLKVHYIIA